MRLEDTDEIMMVTGYIKRSIETLKKILKDETEFKLSAFFAVGMPVVELPSSLSKDSDVVKEALRNWEKIQIIDRIDHLRILGVDITYESLVQ